jgi:hypothetical protein
MYVTYQTRRTGLSQTWSDWKFPVKTSEFAEKEICTLALG